MSEWIKDRPYNMVAIVICLIVLTIVAGIISYFTVYNQTINVLTYQKRALINNLDGWLGINVSRVESNAFLMREMNMPRNALLRYFGLQEQQFEDISLVFAGFPDGSVALGGDRGVLYDAGSTDRPWYVAAAENPGQVVLSRPYIGGETGILSFAVARTVGNEDDSLGVVAVSLPFSRLVEQVDYDNLNGSFSLVLKNDGSILLHPNEMFAVRDESDLFNINEIEDGAHAMMFDIVQSNRSYTNYGTVYLGMPLEIADWYVIVGIPISTVLRHTMPVFFSLLFVIVFTLFAMYAAWRNKLKLNQSVETEIEAKKLYELFVDSSPLVMSIYNTKNEFVMVNNNVKTMFDIEEKSQYGDEFMKFSPEIQPDGSVSADISKIRLNKALNSDERQVFDWMHLTSSGEPLPVQVTLIGFNFGGERLVAAYTIDQRPLRDAMARERESKELLSTVINSSPNMIEIRDEKFNLIHCNDRTAKTFGLANEAEYIVRNEEFVPEYQNGHLSSSLVKIYGQEALDKGSSQYEWEYTLPDGSPLPVDKICVRAKLYGDTVIVSYSHDLRGIKNAIAETHAADERAALMMGATPISCFMIEQFTSDNGSVSFNPIDFNDNAVALFGFKNSEEAFERFEDIFPCSSNESPMDIIYENTRLAFYNGYSKFEFTHRNLSGELIPCDVTIVHVKYRSEATYVCFQNDLRLFKHELNREIYARDTAQMYLDAAPIYIEMYDRDYNLIDCNMSAAEGFGFTEKQDFLDNILQLGPEYQPCGTPYHTKLREIIDACYRDGVVRFEWMDKALNGEIIPTDVSGVRLRRGNDDVIVWYMQDLRAIKLAMEREREADEHNRAKTQFLAKMSHEIRTPMNSVLGIAEIELRKNIHTYETEEAFRRIYSSSRMLINIINDILDLSKVEAGRMEIAPASYETADLIADVLQLNLMYIGSKQIEFILDIDENLPTFLYGDELRIKQILNNILSNAFKYTTEGYVKLTFTEKEDVAGFVLLISVADTGQGMSNEQVTALFDNEYTRFNLEKNRHIEGSGLGMSIAKALVNMMDGSISVESESGVGSTFTVEIPQQIVNIRAIGKEISENLQRFETGSTGTKNTSVNYHQELMPYGSVLVVDDVESNIYVVKGYLVPYKLKIDAVSNAKDAIDLVKAGNVYDIIFMDHMMPEMDGVKAVAVLREEMGYTHPIIALTANATVGASQMFMDNGFNGFISKPIAPNKLHDALIKFIQTKEKDATLPVMPTDFTHKQKAELRRTFLADANKSKNTLESLMQILEADNLEAAVFKLYVIQTHAVKSALRNIGCTELAETADFLETAGRMSDLEKIRSTTNVFLSNLSKIITLITEVKDMETDENEDRKAVAKLLFSIAAACEAYNIQLTRDLLREIKRIPLSESTKDVISKIENHLFLSDDDEAGNLAKLTAEKMNKL